MRRFMEALAPFRETKQAKAALAKIMGDKVVPIRVKRSIKEYQPPRATPLDPADPQESNPLVVQQGGAGRPPSSSRASRRSPG